MFITLVWSVLTAIPGWVLWKQMLSLGCTCLLWTSVKGRWKNRIWPEKKSNYTNCNVGSTKRLPNLPSVPTLWCKNCALEYSCQTGMAMPLYSVPSSLGRRRADKWRLSADHSWGVSPSLKGNLNGTFLCLPQHLRETGYKSRPYMQIISNKECVSKLVSIRGSGGHSLMRGSSSAQPARQNI